MGRRLTIISRCSNIRISTLFPARAIASTCLYSSLNERGLQVTLDARSWLREVTNDKVDLADFDEILDELRRARGIEKL